ncbi:MBOAT family O-acyltransferase [Faecalibaculum rodentium]|uniref:MBOAT family O-acyltransferase n=1 Tax=Faecalibaculum rodentium TaxID=1702221 RepID=UPI002730C849|nr:MBOAT family O-acyltransferase [Faecalibaculum rodentium]
MVFSSLVFLCVFLPVVLFLYYSIQNNTWRNGLLIAASLLFYAYGEPRYILLMLFSIFMNYGFGLLAASRYRKSAVWLAVAANIGLLFVFKYLDMVILWINSITGMGIPPAQIPLPIGISFFTFQALSYVIDVYRKEVKPQHNLFYIMLYISFFPQLIAGPIVKYHDIDRQIVSRTIDAEEIALGFRRFITGLAKKVLIANTMAFACDQLMAAQPVGGLNMAGAWTLALTYLFQIYFDFSGYSDMAIGLGQMFGFHFKENFNYPYISCSIQEFWRRWHISLSTWFKEYLYIPLGGNRKGKLRTSLNKLIVFMATGIWHGANLTFLVWGLWHGLFIMLEQWVPLKRVPVVLRWLATMLIVILGFVIFRADTLHQGIQIIQTMFTGFSAEPSQVNLLHRIWTPVLVFAIFLAAVFSFPVVPAIKKLDIPCIQAGSFGLSIVMLVLIMLNLAGGSYNPFIYFRF